ncbi:SdpI family protein [Streptomyces sp. NPDC085665]|uniref:SdpI family protein n=1 Tax=Streptomyces sp. NPDC085665 TaxID=3365735 RepID=UPI0037CD8F51
MDAGLLGGRVMDPVGGLISGMGLMAPGLAIRYVANQVTAGRIGRNSAVGIRTKATLSSDRAWEAGHAAAWSMLRAASLTACIAASATFGGALAMTLTGGDAPALLVVPLVWIGLILALLTVAGVRANAAAREADRTTG